MPENRENLFQALGAEIQAMCALDQEARHKWIDNKGDEEAEAFKNLDLIHTERMKEIVREIGWPTISKVGKNISRDAWLLIQHASHDSDFQKECLVLMKEAGQDVDGGNVAYLEDRIRVNEGQLQRYGTQFNGELGENFGPRPIEDPEHVDQRRATLGLMPLEEYKRELIEKYKL